MKRAITFSILLTGFIAMASQIVFVRELLIVFYGNELSIAFILAGWLIAGAIGSLLLGVFADRINNRTAVFSVCQLVMAALLPLGVIAIRSIKTVLDMNAGEIIPFFPMMVSSFVTIAPLCIMLGFMFSLACRVYGTFLAEGAANIGKVYILEAVGSMAGGYLTGSVLVRALNPVQITAVFSLLMLFAALVLTGSSPPSRSRPLILVIAAIALVAGILGWFSGGWDSLNRRSLDRQWRGYDLLASENSIYGNVAIAKNAGQFSFFGNGLHLYTIPNKQASEEAAHFALLEHPSPESVLLIGGGPGGLVEEILKHPVENIDYIELDGLIVKMAKTHLPGPYYAPLEDPRVSIRFEDGRFFTKTTDRAYDVIIVNLGDPYTAQLNRFYTAEFFNEIKRILKQGGVLSFGLSSSDSYISGPLGDFLRSIYTTLKASFGEVRIIPGETAYFLASDAGGLLTYDYKILMDRAGQRNLDIRYVREYYLFSTLSPEKTSYVENIVKTKGRVNRDFQPISYYYDIIFWATRFKDSLFAKALKAVTEKVIWALIAAFCVFALSFKRSFRKTVIIAVIANGFSQMTFQVVILLSFQMIYGYLFYKLGFILTSFMLGLALGALTSIRAASGLKIDTRLIVLPQAAICLYPLVLPVIFHWLAGSRSDVESWIGSNIIFAFLPAAAGFAGGFLFPLANRILLAEGRGVGRVAGLNYGSDLFGSCAGALLTGAFLVPVLGIPKTCLAAAVINMAVLVTLASSRKRYVVSGK